MPLKIILHDVPSYWKMAAVVVFRYMSLGRAPIDGPPLGAGSVAPVHHRLPLGPVAPVAPVGPCGPAGPCGPSTRMTSPSPVDGGSGVGDGGAICTTLAGPSKMLFLS